MTINNHHSNKIFVLGVGAQKAGTTWLYRYIERSNDAYFGFAKEYHVWDAMYVNSCKIFRLETGKVLSFEEFLKFHMQNTNSFYESYFNSILNSKFRITGDITPSYSMLSPSDWVAVKARLLGIKANIKIVFLMRDPVERCWSAVRFYKRLHGWKKSDEELLSNLFSSEEFELRTRYEKTCKNIHDNFSQEDIYFGFYENMFNPESVANLSDFLSLPVNFTFASKIVNASAKIETIPRDLRLKVQDYYAETYNYCTQQFPETNRLWNV